MCHCLSVRHSLQLNRREVFQSKITIAQFIYLVSHDAVLHYLLKAQRDGVIIGHNEKLVQLILHVLRTNSQEPVCQRLCVDQTVVSWQFVVFCESLTTRRYTWCHIWAVIVCTFTKVGTGSLFLFHAFRPRKRSIFWFLNKGLLKSDRTMKLDHLK